MAEEFTDLRESRVGRQKIAGHGVTQTVRTDRFDARPNTTSSDDHRHPATGQRPHRRERSQEHSPMGCLLASPPQVTGDCFADVW